jgi:hypothetical protein
MSKYRAAAIAGLAASILCLCKFACADDPFQRTATKALRGDFGKLHDWQRIGYTRGLKLGVTTSHKFLVTAYHAGEGRDGRIDNRGRPCTERTAASNRVKRGSYIWTEAWGIRQVLDCGARSNDRKADRAGCDSWLDLWFPSARAARRAGCDGWAPTAGAVVPGGE